MCFPADIPFFVCASLTVTLKVLGPRRTAKRCRRRQKGRRRMEQKAEEGYRVRDHFE